MQRFLMQSCLRKCKKLLISWWLCKDCSASGNSLFETIATISRHCLFRIQHHSFVFPTKGRHVSRCAECIVSEITTFSGFCDPRGKKSFGVNGGVNCNLRPFDFKLLSRVKNFRKTKTDRGEYRKLDL